jgi:hypothetical protein
MIYSSMYRCTLPKNWKLRLKGIVHRSIVHNSQKLEATQMSINRWINKMYIHKKTNIVWFYLLHEVPRIVEFIEMVSNSWEMKKMGSCYVMCIKFCLRQMKKFWIWTVMVWWCLHSSVNVSLNCKLRSGWVCSFVPYIFNLIEAFPLCY